MVQDLVGLPIANASLLDEATAVAEAVLLMRRANKNKAAHDGKTVLDADCLPQTIAIVKGRAEALGFEVEVADLSTGPARGRHQRRRPAAAGRLRPRVRPLRRDRRRQGTRRAGHRGRGPAGPDPDHPSGRAGRGHRRRLHPALRRAAVLRRPARRLHGRARRAWSAPCPAASWASPRTTPASRPTAWRCRPASSTSAARRPRPTSAPRRRCWPSCPPSTPSTTAPTA